MRGVLRDGAVARQRRVVRRLLLDLVRAIRAEAVLSQFAAGIAAFLVPFVAVLRRRARAKEQRRVTTVVMVVIGESSLVVVVEANDGSTRRNARLQQAVGPPDDGASIFVLGLIGNGGDGSVGRRLGHSVRVPLGRERATLARNRPRRRPRQRSSRLLDQRSAQPPGQTRREAPLERLLRLPIDSRCFRRFYVFACYFI